MTGSTTPQPPQRRSFVSWLMDRPTGDLLVLMITTTVCGAIVFGGTALLVFAFVHPEVDATQAARSVVNILNTMVGLLAGFLAGRTDRSIRNGRNTSSSNTTEDNELS